MEKEIKRDQYLNRLIQNMHNSFIKVVTGVRRCGKSYLLRHIFVNYLLSQGVSQDHIIILDLELNSSKEYLNPDKLYEYVMSKVKDNEMYYLILDEVEKVTNFEAVLMDFLEIPNIDCYVTGSNSKFLSRDVITEFRGRGKEIYITPITYREYYNSLEGDKKDALMMYFLYGGLPQIILMDDLSEKQKTLKSFFMTTYQRDIIERYSIEREDILSGILDILSSSVGSLTNPNKIYDTLKSQGVKNNISINTIISYFNYLIDAFLIFESPRYNLRTRKHMLAPSKYYFVDTGLRNARLNFTSVDIHHIMENVVYNELISRGYEVSTGIVPYKTQNRSGSYEIDFIAVRGNERYYIQVSDNIDTKEKEEQELSSFYTMKGDYTKRILILNRDIWHTYNEMGVLILGINEFLLDENSLKL